MITASGLILAYDRARVTLRGQTKSPEPVTQISERGLKPPRDHALCGSWGACSTA